MEKTLYKTNYIKKEIDKYEYVSFDVFDTLIKRNVSHYRDIFTLTCLEYEKRTGKQINGNYEQKRIEAEEKAREKREDKEPNIHEIYEQMEIEEDKNLLKQIEIELELAICQQNKDFYEIYKYCQEKGKKIIIISDMYLNRQYIEEILNKNKISNYEKLFISNEEKLNKYTGKIYPYILKKIGIKPNQIIHIGDSKRADYLMPKKYKIKSILIPKKINKLSYYNKSKNMKDQNEFYYNIIESFINNNISQNKDSYYKIGYEILGILLYGYSKWLLNNLQENQINKVFFLAREGALLKKAFDELNNKNIETKYLYASRRSTQVTLLKYIEKVEDVFKIVKMRRVVDLKAFFINVGLNIENYENLMKKYKCNKDTNIKDIKEFEKLFNEIKADIIQNAKKEEENLVTYLKQQEFEGKIAVCDVGWVGTMQHSLEEIAKSNNIQVNVTGFYMGQADKAKEFIKQGMKSNSYLFDYNSEEYLQLRAFLNLFESFFLAQHGTTIKYEIKNGKVEPILDECEYSKQEKEKFQNIQLGAMQFIKDYKEFDKYDIKIAPEIAWRNFKKLGLKPTMHDIKLFGDISYLETTKVQFANPHNIFYYIIHPKKLYYDFCNCSWKIGFLKKLFKIKLDYFKIYKIMLKDKR